MPQQPTKADLQETVSQVEELVDEALDPELTREALVAKVKEMSEVVSGDEDEEDDGDEEEEGQDLD